MLALDRGYSAEQIEQHVESLGSLGDIEGVDPAGEPVGLTDVVAAPPQGFAVRSGSQRVSDATPEELLEVAMVVALAARGYGPDQIVEALVLGTIGADPPRTPCIVITDALPVVGDGESFPCPPIALADQPIGDPPGTNDEPNAENSSEPDDSDGTPSSNSDREQGDVQVAFTGRVEDQGTLDVEWTAPIDDGSGSGAGQAVLFGPCTGGIDGEPVGEVIEADITATYRFVTEVSIVDGTLSVTTSGHELIAYTGREGEEGCRDVFELLAARLGTLLDGSVVAESGPVVLGGIEGNLSVE